MKYTTERLLTTAEAARLLRVSQASIRRWSDSGLLRARRVGRRRERRFSESDVMLFLNSGAEPRRPEASSPLVNVGGIEVAVPTHLATYYASDQARLRLTLPFLADGLRAGQPCFLAATGPVLDLYREALRRQDGVHLDQAERDGEFVATQFDGTAPGAIAQWEDALGRLLAQRPSVIRIVGEMLLVRTMFRSEDEMLLYEEQFEVMYKRYPVVVICQYDVRGFSGLAVLRSLKAHPGLYGQRIGAFLN